MQRKSEEVKFPVRELLKESAGKLAQVEYLIVGGVRFNGRRPAILSEKEPPPGWPMSRLASFVEDLLDDHRPVLHRTGLKGIYAFKLDYSKDGIDRPLPVPALRDQLGLGLQSAKAPADTAVIDRVEHPSEN